MNPPDRPPRSRWLGARLLAICLLGCGLPQIAQAALHLQLDTAALDADERSASQALFDDVQARLPDAWRQALETVPVQWRDDLPAAVHGRATGAGQVLLPRSLLYDWMRASDEAARTPARAALVHELAHLLDRSAAGGFSRDSRLLDLAGWQIGSWPRLKLRLRHNAFTDRTPDAYELFSPQEYVAVNLEHRILDADYACRRPLLDAYFAQRLGSTPQAGRDCAPGVAFFEDRPAAPVLALDPERVYAVDYLLADGNDAPMSRWGHSMLRLVICAPGRPRGPDCRLDLQYQRVLSFRAFIDDVQISSWGGLTGRYPSRLYLLPMLQVIDDYTQGQLRGLRSVPLTLSRAQIAALLQRAAQVHWSYDGGYRFASNNCAFETYKLLRDGVPALDAGGQLSGITPNGLLRRLEQARIADGRALADLEQAGRAGYYFAPASAQYQAMLDIARARLGLPAQSVEDWLSQPPQRRAPWIERADLRASAALLVLEQAARRRQDLLARDALKRRFLHGGGDADLDAGRTRLRDLLEHDGLFAQPALLLQGQPGYGLPQQAERDFLQAKGSALLGRQHAARDTLEHDARLLLPQDLRDQIDGTQANLAALGERLRTLERDTGVPSLRGLAP